MSPWDEVYAVIQDINNEFQTKEYVDDESKNINIKKDIHLKLSYTYRKGLITFEMDYLLNFLTDKQDYTDTKISKFYEVDRKNVTRWKNEGQIADHAIFRAASTRAELSFENYKPSSAFSRHAAGILAMLHYSRVEILKDSSGLENNITVEWLDIFICLFKSYSFSIDSAFVNKNKSTHGKILFSEIKKFAHAKFLSDDQISKILSKWLKPFYFVLLNAGHRFDFARNKCPDLVKIG